jgi:outer membrane protein OmpA-like peptidoglycan-associated protein
MPIMQKGPSQVSSGNIGPAVMGPQRDTKDAMILATLVLFLAGLMAAAWYYGQTSDQVKIAPTTEKIENASVSEMLKKASVLNQAEASTTSSSPVTAPAMSLPEIIYADVYFDVGRKGLNDEGKALLATQTDFLKQHGEYGVLIQGYTDQQGSAGYNKKLGLKRAEAVKAELVNAGVAEYRIAVLSLGEEGVLCVDTSTVCRHMNRRVHLEIRKIGQEHMAAPAVDGPSSVPSEAGIDSSIRTGDAGSSTESLQPLNPEPTPGS